MTAATLEVGHPCRPGNGAKPEDGTRRGDLTVFDAREVTRLGHFESLARRMTSRKRRRWWQRSHLRPLREADLV